MFVPPQPSRASVLLAALARQTLRPIVRGIRPGARDDQIRRALAIVDRRTRYLHVPLSTPLRGASVHRVDLDTCEAEWIAAAHRAAVKRVILYFHGGGFVIGGPQTHRRLVSRLSAACGGTPVCSVEYRQLPDVPIADSVGDCVRAYQCLLRRYASSEIVLAGDSAGGHLALAVAVASRKLELPQPAGIFAISPWIDLAADAVHRCPNVGSDPYITPNMLSWIGHLHESRFGPLRTELCDSDCDLSGVAPTLIQVGGLEILVSDAEAFTARLVADGVPCQLQVYPGQMHVFHLLADVLPEARFAIHELALFVEASTRPHTAALRGQRKRLAQGTVIT
ncbi:alpha/beta hydrolase [Mycobacterium xenopi]|uniref:alpha/beta hydrolase n=1 Tax=Mycobacterium xenopi TaxID=1789 RepID=UPI000A23541E|nr:alpha/beta hydrolase [Mycobacterium xenopi]MDA3642158.1 alpha/beta hydrolase [Mycobacterium xenopi]MDA3660248.1 alpha/beta hydrolase [Mycobacterium xenopi]MDA3664783.1 alpha/beta hydrolase [Mycobacterium xenopi]ORX21365.1 hypothetical protein AWC32_23590 [Mycobacterium xenopi]